MNAEVDNRPQPTVYLRHDPVPKPPVPQVDGPLMAGRSELREKKTETGSASDTTVEVA